jgi:hypothetical protein
MKTGIKGILVLVTVVFVLLLWLPVSRFIASRRDYGEAEPLVQVIWPMALEMKRFSEERGHSPNSLDEIARFSPDLDFSPLRRYAHEFSSGGPHRFFLRVNSRFAFTIGEDYTPQWVFPQRSATEHDIPLPINENHFTIPAVR